MANYGTIVDGDTYFASRLNADAWDDATDADKTKALTQSTRAIDLLNYLGEKTDEDQVNQFPRDDDSAVPDDIEYACYEESLSLLDGVVPELEFENLSQVAQGYKNVRSTYDRSQLAQHIVAGIASVTAWRYIKPYLRDGNVVAIQRVS